MFGEHERGDKDWQDTCFGISEALFKVSDKKNPLFDFYNHRSLRKRHALVAKCEGLINQNPAFHLQTPLKS